MDEGRRTTEEGRKASKWYHKSWALVIGFLAVGPFVIPLVWSNPKFSLAAKTIITVIILVITGWLVILTLNTIQAVLEQYRYLSGELNM